jgi:hypothetical protein
MNRFAIRSTRVGSPAVVCLILVVLLAFPTAASAQKRRVPIEEDNHAFRFILDSLGLEPTYSNHLSESPEKCILIVFGDTHGILKNLPADFVERGGAILVATDRRTPEELAKAFGVQVTGQFVKTKPDLGYLGKAECPFVKPLGKSGISKSLFTGRHGPLEHLATNRPSLMNLMESSQLHPLAAFANGCWVELGRDLPIWWESPFAAGAEIGKGRVLILSDHSIFINSMMLQADNDNFNFAFNCVHWLKEGNKRTRVLFYDENEIVADFKVPIKVIKEFPVPRIEVMDQLLANLEQENIFNRLILGNDPRGMFQMILRILAVTLTGGLVLLGFYWLLQNRHRLEVKAPLFAKTALGLAPAAAVVAQRHQALIKEDNLWEVGRDLSRDWFADRFQEIPGTRPRISVRTSWWKRRGLEKKVNALWQLAYGPPRRLSAQHFARVVADLAQVESAWANESLRFEE